ncbi:MAG: hypothetical protein K2N56_07975 [Oscillospiraceae bacterium]|nr:hypothetical protein [Oscillospiraceae bacterium]
MLVFGFGEIRRERTHYALRIKRRIAAQRDRPQIANSDKMARTTIKARSKGGCGKNNEINVQAICESKRGSGTERAKRVESVLREAHNAAFRACFRKLQIKIRSFFDGNGAK